MLMDIKQNVSLAAYSTMRLGGQAAYLAEIHTVADLQQAVNWAEQYKLPFVMIGGGSNIIWSDKGFPGLVLVNKIMGFDLQEEDEENSYLTVGAGEPWDSVVSRVVGLDLSGIEELSLIPGSAGATPIQNVGAYGREIADSLVSVTAYDRQAKKLINIPKIDCGFAYRTSRFRTTDKGRFLITAITLHLTKTKPMPPFYPAVQTYFEQHGITDCTVLAVRQAVVAIRTSKLPDPAVVANCGSFFYNPIITAEEFNRIKFDHPELEGHSQPDGRLKISAAWLVEKAGFKDFHDLETGMATWPKQPLVFINERAPNTTALLVFREKVKAKIKEMFGIDLEQEPELVNP